MREKLASQTALQRQGTRAKVFRTSAWPWLRARRGGQDRWMAVEISGVTLCPSDDLITAAYLDYPRTGTVDGYAFDAYGWVLRKVPAAEVEFVHQGIVTACCELEVQRPDVAKKFGSSSRVGFWKEFGTFGFAPAFTVGGGLSWKMDAFARLRKYAARSSSPRPSLPPRSQSRLPAPADQVAPY